LIMVIKDVIEFIQQHVPFRYHATEFPKNQGHDCGFVRIEAGSPPDIYIVGLKSPSIQVAIRHDSGSEAERIAKEIWNLFHGKSHFYIGETKVYFTKCDQSEPIYLGKDNNGRTMYSINVSCKTFN